MPIPKGTKVVQVIKPIEGVIMKTEFDEDANCLKYLVSFETDDGTQERWFTEDQIVAKGEEA